MWILFKRNACMQHISNDIITALYLSQVDVGTKMAPAEANTYDVEKTKAH